MSLMSLCDSERSEGAANETAGSTCLLLSRSFSRNAVVRQDHLRPNPDGRARRLRLAVSKPFQGRAMPADPDGQSARRDLQQDALSIRRDFRRGTRGRRPPGMRPGQDSQGRGLRRLRRMPAQGHPSQGRMGGGADGHPRLLAESKAGRLLPHLRSIRGRRRALRGGEVHRAG